ncbi:MAG: hypothetical protein A2X05_18400 [Bacteroidetes bacterium GWE2_41_25]|nr:MAG: hypothetical protein A2X03_07335 [Bacteroidetes bacterium GWA2_40_15]OFX84509.1 MAG: hypothetical protein A2X06_11395 [Bacteroidetes bacterium GWC2_40_22]OFY04355.1 MAG: hypothetical protein A2X05_18400 [Bacteroidetes bacterium GWE2_41_25]OFY56873.1 MAG: hypothetical protein A2X04_06275 [Bacteroidetes bacterium GWF2_41_9]HAM11380.1 AAA family ATPase [Bacteroidales bacterium]
MNPVNNPFTPGAGTPPPELAGRETVLQDADNAIKRTLNNKIAKSQIMLGLRGVGKTVLLNKIYQIAEDLGTFAAIFEASSSQTLPETMTQPLYRLLLKLDRSRKTENDIKRVFGLLGQFARLFKVKIGEFEVGIDPGILTGDLALDLGDLFVLIGEAAKSRHTAVIILIDEVQYLEEDDLAALILAMHRISQKQLPILLFGAGLPQLAKLAGDAKSYAERLFDYITIDKLDNISSALALERPVLRENVKFEPEAVGKIIEETEGYPYFIQLWGSLVWDIAKASPITINDVVRATEKSVAMLDSGFFRIRYERLTERQQDYAKAMARAGKLPVSSAEVAEIMGITVRQAAPIRDEVMKKGMAYSPGRGLISFSVPKFEDYLRRNFIKV